MNLNPCPCGEVPTDLCINEGSTHRWVYVSGNCCGVWEMEVRVNFHPIDSQQTKDAAISAWNEAPRKPASGVQSK